MTDDKLRFRRNGNQINDDVFHAIVDAFSNSIGHLLDGREVVFYAGDDYAEATFAVEYPEIPYIENGHFAGWKPSYMAREQVDAALADALPDGYSYEAVNNATTAVYRD